MYKIHNRILSYLIVTAGLAIIYIFLRDSSWQSTAQMHTLMESISTLLAVIVGIIALVRYYSNLDDASLIIGTGFLGTGILDCYHVLLTSIWSKHYLPSLSPWSWFSPRLFLAVVLYYSYRDWHVTNFTDNKNYLKPQLIYSVAAFYTLTSFLFIAFSPLPSAYYPNLPFHRPQEFIPALFFALALIGYLRKGAWRDNSFEHWLVLALIVNLVAQAIYMSSSSQVYDMEFGVAHLFKMLSYLCVLVGLFINMFDNFKQVLKESNERQTALTNSQERYRSVIDTVLEGIITINERGLVSSMNPAAEKTFGYKASEVIGQNIKMLMPEPYQSEHDGYIRNYLTSGVAKIIGVGREVQGKRKDGSVFPMELGVSEMVIDGQRMFSGLVRDITERKNFEMALSNHKARLRAIIDAVLEGIITINERGLVSSMNPAAERIFGYKKNEVIGQNVNMLMPEPYHSEHDGYLHNYMTTGVAKIIGIGREVQGQRINGEVFPMELSVSEIQIDNKRMFIGLVRDITERKKVDKMKNEFISTVSHELRTPLTSIQGSLELILSGVMGELPEECIPLLDIANTNSARLVRLINDILDIEKIESGNMEFRPKTVELMAIVQDSIAANQAIGDEYGVNFIISSHVPNCYVLADSDRLIQVLTNLLSNAAKFSPEGETVEVSVRLHNNNIRVSVTDHGPGIPEEFRQRIFSKFSQADASSTKQQGGTGLGLNICKAIIEKLGGHIDYDSEINKNTCFYFELPVIGKVSEDMESRVEPDKGAILICEDDNDVANFLKLLLEKNGYSADIAHSAEQAKQKLLSKHYAAMTLDLLLPGQSGVDFIKELKQTARFTEFPVIIISAVAEKGKKELKNAAVSVYDWLDKPIDQRRLESAVNNALKVQTKNNFRILHVEDDPDIVTLVNTLLKSKADVDVATDLNSAEIKLQQDYDLVILDLQLPDGSGCNLLPMLADRKPPIPVVVFSAIDKSEELKDKVNSSFVKSKTSNEDLIKSIELILQQKPGKIS